MTDRLLVDLAPGGRVSVSAWLDGELPGAAVGEPFELVWPLDEERLEDLRWYLEDYLRAPYGVYGDKGERVAGALEGWGEAVFGAVFGAGPARDGYVRVRARSGVGTEVVFRSSSAALLGLPWELLRDPGRPTPLALDLVGVTRSLPASELREAFVVEGERVRVLMVISRPSGVADVGYRMVARPLLERLETVRGQVDLVVLRPPTLDNLDATLAAARAQGQPFQLVHFDGHGVLARRPVASGPGARSTFETAAAEGMLAFEKPGGGSEDVPAASLARVLAEARVPLVVLNACQSGAVGKDLEAAVATRLLQEGAASVVAMAYTVYAVAAADFMAAFYERLLAGDRVTEAVTAGRRRLARSALRPSPKGKLPLADWVVPVHYMRREVHFPYLRTRPRQASLDQLLDDIRNHVEEADRSLESAETFVGRDGLFYELEVAARLQRVVVLHGTGGTGKTELAKAFGRWWRDTGGVERPDLVIFQSFEPGVASFGLDGIVAQIGLHVFGPDFARLDATERTTVVERLLHEHRLLLIWDNFEAVRTMPDPTGATPPLDEPECQVLRGFLQRAVSGQSSVIITSRTDEAWLGDLRRVPVGGLISDEAIEYADQRLAAYPAAAPRRAKPAFADLLAWLDGHPLSMRLILPHLATAEPETLLEGLRGIGELAADTDHHPERTTSLTASVTYSFDHLNPTTRRLLPAVALFHGVADVNVLASMSQVPSVPERFANIDSQAWTNALDSAATVGLLTSLGAGMYRIHPALPAYLAAQWRREEPHDHDHQGQATIRALLTAHAELGTWLQQQILSGDAGFAYAIIDRQRRTLGQLLGSALDTNQWEEAQAIVQPLDYYFEARGLHEEARAWVDRARLALEGADGTPPPLQSPAGALWLFVVGAQAKRELGAHRLDPAERTYLDILSMLQAQPASDQQQSWLATNYHQLGMVAQERGRLDDAEDWYQQSRTLKEQLGDQPGLAATYHQLGLLAEDRGRLDDAEDWYQQSRTLKEQLGDRRSLATTYHQLGMVAQYRGQLDDAEDWYQQSRTVKEQLGDQRGLASTYHHLGMVALDRKRPDDAEDWSRQALTIAEQLGDQPLLTSTYYQLGNVAYLRQRLDDAEDWYQRALTLAEQRGDQRGLASIYGQLGVLAEARGRDVVALEWIVRCFALVDEFPHPATAPILHPLARLTSKLGTDALESSWRAVTGSALPQAIRDFVTNAQEAG